MKVGDKVKGIFRRNGTGTIIKEYPKDNPIDEKLFLVESHDKPTTGRYGYESELELFNSRSK